MDNQPLPLSNYQAPPAAPQSPAQLPPQPAKSSFQPSTLKAAMLAFYVVVLIIGMLSAYGGQHSQLQSTKQELAAAKAQISRQADEANTLTGSVNSAKYQAVFLSSGQVYFGKVAFLDQHYLTLTNIYYLQSASKDIQQGAAVSGNTSLIKLGCELHAPDDKMTINRDRIDFWEDLKDNSQVVKAIQTFAKSNPSGQRCAAG